MADRSLVGRCGLYCGACGIYRAYKDDGEYLKRVAEYFKCPSEKVRCEGCQALTPECWGTGCKMVQCLKARGYGFCYECPDYEKRSCEQYEKFSKNYLEEDGVDLRANLARIKAGETDEWLRESEAKYKCKNCGKPLPYGRIKTKCYNCGQDLSK